jgi:hypothetical protein
MSPIRRRESTGFRQCMPVQLNHVQVHLGPVSAVYDRFKAYPDNYVNSGLHEHVFHQKNFQFIHVGMCFEL